MQIRKVSKLEASKGLKDKFAEFVRDRPNSSINNEKQQEIQETK